jgi:DNA-binding CsgD family transcriptional regulator
MRPELGIEWPLAGRVGELRQLQRLQASGEHHGVVIAGPPGVGKTRLARESLTLAERSGAATAWITATRSAAGLPFGAIAPLLPPPSQGTESDTESRTELLRRAVAFLADTARGRPLTLAVDDAHLLDDASATLLYQLAMSRTAFTLLTIRTGEVVPDPITALWKDGLAVRLELPGLPADAVGEVLSSVLGGQVDPATVAHLSVHSEGNALFLREMVLGALDDGTLVDDGGIWRHTRPLSPSVRLVELVEARLGSLTVPERELLEILCYGEPLGAAELSAVSSPEVAEGLERRGLLVSVVDGRRLSLRPGHPLYADVIRGRTPAIRMRMIARSLADSLASTGTRRREDPLRVATWRLDGGGEADPGLMLNAAATARWRYDFDLAERLGSAALAAGAGFEAALLVAQLAGLQGRIAEAEERLAGLIPEAASDADRARVILVRLENLNFALGQKERALAIAQEAEASISDPAWRAEIAATRSALLLHTRGARDAAECAMAVVERGAGRARVLASLVASFSLSRLGRLQAAFDAAQQSEDASRMVSRPLDWYPWFSEYVRCECLAQAGQLVEADAVARRHYGEGLRNGSAEGRAWFAWSLARRVAERGDVNGAARQAREAASLFRQLGRRPFERAALVPLAVALALARRSKEATEVLHSVDVLPVDPDMSVAVDVLHARALATMTSGHLTQGRELLADAVTLGEQIGDLVGAAAALHTLVRVDRPQEHLARLRAVAAEIEGELAPARAAHALALVRHDAGGLDAVSEAFARMGAHLLAAYAAVDACRLWERAADPRAAPARVKAAELAARCEGAVIPGLNAGDRELRLTPAETETALLVAAGHSNREIAEMLDLSVRTIENRLQRVYEKLGISRRTDLATLFTGTASSPPSRGRPAASRWGR